MLDGANDDMSPEARTERLYWFLLNMGLVVEPEMKEGHWCALRVAVNSATQSAQESSSTGVVAPVEGAEIRRTIAPAQNGGDGVVNFPAKC